MSLDPTIVAEARTIAEQFRNRLRAEMSDADRDVLFRKLTTSVKNNLRANFASSIKSMLARDEALIHQFSLAIRDVARRETPDPIHFD
jgi:hypothetical protein